MVVAHQSGRGSSPRATEGHRLPYSRLRIARCGAFLFLRTGGSPTTRGGPVLGHHASPFATSFRLGNHHEPDRARGRARAAARLRMARLSLSTDGARPRAPRQGQPPVPRVLVDATFRTATSSTAVTLRHGLSDADRWARMRAEGCPCRSDAAERSSARGRVATPPTARAIRRSVRRRRARGTSRRESRARGR